MKRLFCAAVATFVAMSLAGQADAQHYEGGLWKVTGYRVGADGSLFGLNPAPKACGNGSNFGEHINVAPDAPNRDEIVASLMTAYITGERISGIWFRNLGPCDNTTALNVFMIRMAAKE